MSRPLRRRFYPQEICINPGKMHWNVLTHVLRHIKLWLGFRIICGGKYKDLAPVGYVDADYAGDFDNRCSVMFLSRPADPRCEAPSINPSSLSTTEAD